MLAAVYSIALGASVNPWEAFALEASGVWGKPVVSAVFEPPRGLFRRHWSEAPGEVSGGRVGPTSLRVEAWESAGRLRFLADGKVVSVRALHWPKQHANDWYDVQGWSQGWNEAAFRSLGADALVAEEGVVRWREAGRRSGTVFVRDLQALFPEVGLHWWAREFPLALAFESVGQEELLQAVARAVFCEVRESETGRALMIEAAAFTDGLAELRVTLKNVRRGTEMRERSIRIGQTIARGLTQEQVDQLMIKPRNFLTIMAPPGSALHKILVDHWDKAVEESQRVLSAQQAEDFLMWDARYLRDVDWSVEFYSSTLIRLDGPVGFDERTGTRTLRALP